LQGGNACVRHENAATGTELTKISLMQGMDVDIGRVGLEDGGGRIAVAQQWANSPGFVRVDQARISRDIGQCEERGQFCQLIVSGDVERSARAHERVLGETFGRRIKEVAEMSAAERPVEW
jgi:hypothetical protein